MTTQLTEAEFKNVIENKLSVLLSQGDWTAKLDAGVKTLKYNNGSSLIIFIHTHTVEVVTSGHVVELTNTTLVQRVEDCYFTIKEAQDAEAQATMQKRVLDTINKLASFLEPM